MYIVRCLVCISFVLMYALPHNEKRLDNIVSSVIQKLTSYIIFVLKNCYLIDEVWSSFLLNYFLTLIKT